MPTRTAAERPAAHLRHGQRGWSWACRAGSSGRAARWLAHLCSSCHQPGLPRRRGPVTWTARSGGRSGPPRARGLSYCHGSFNFQRAASRASRDDPADRPRRPRAAVRRSLEKPTNVPCQPTSYAYETGSGSSVAAPQWPPNRQENNSRKTTTFFRFLFLIFLCQISIYDISHTVIRDSYL